MNKINKRKLITIIGLLLVLVINNSGCIFNNDSGWIQDHWATYNLPLNSSAIIQEFKENNISYTYSAPDEFGYESILFYFGKGINNNSIKSSRGSIGIYTIEKSTQLSVSLDDLKYPPVKDKKELSKQKPLLVKSFEYIEKIIYDVTGQWPASKNISIGDTD